MTHRPSAKTATCPRTDAWSRLARATGVLALLSVLLDLTNFVTPVEAGEIIAGADYSHLAFFETRGIVYRENGQPRDALALLKDRGLTCVRLRLFTSSAAQAQAAPYNSINNLDYTLPLARRVKEAGLQFWLDFHYSDTWADPGHQSKPAAWTNLSFVQLTQQMRQYNSNCIAAFKAVDAMPDYVQVGNEITTGMLWPDGQVGGGYDTPTQWAKLSQLLTNSIAGIRDAAGTQMPRIIIHIDRGGDWAGTQWFFDHLQQQQVPFDIVGLSYYPFWHGSLADLRTCLTNAATRYAKPVLVAETAFPWANSADIQGIPASTNGQVQFVVALAQIINTLPSRRGIGVCWWGSEYQTLPGTPLAGFDKRSFFNSTGDILPVAAALGQLASPVILETNLNTNGVSVSWPLSGAGLGLETTTNLSAAGTWLQVTNPVQVTGTESSVTLPLNTPPAQFLRLRAH